MNECEFRSKDLTRSFDNTIIIRLQSDREYCQSYINKYKKMLGLLDGMEKKITAILNE
ncbi:MAG: hypothetical protein ACUZ8E_17360 [Candidatus Anammoxibacter sp.]